MRVSSKGRYALAAMIHLAQNYNTGELISVISISEQLGISKIYLEQVFSLLKRGGLVNSMKGAQGGYQLAKEPKKITAFDVLSAVELALFEKTEETVAEKAPDIDAAMQVSVFGVLDDEVKAVLNKITLADLLAQTEKNKAESALMFYI
jgi:Rrf2 family protein